MATAEFSYKEVEGRCYPVILVHLRNKNLEDDFYALIDSGASISTFRAEVAESLGIKIEEGERRISVGISGKVEVFVHQLELKVFDKWFPCKIAFSRHLTTSFNLLGREGFFEKHLVTFNENEKKIILTEV